MTSYTPDLLHLLDRLATVRAASARTLDEATSAIVVSDRLLRDSWRLLMVRAARRDRREGSGRPAGAHPEPEPAPARVRASRPLIAVAAVRP
jgi:hypothetical protein